MPAGAQGCDGVEHADEVRGDVRIGPVTGAVLELEASGQFETFVLELGPRMPGAVFEHGVDGLPGDVLRRPSGTASAGPPGAFVGTPQSIRRFARLRTV